LENPLTLPWKAIASIKTKDKQMKITETTLKSAVAKLHSNIYGEHIKSHSQSAVTRESAGQ
jgi:hypothetical protein